MGPAKHETENKDLRSQNSSTFYSIKGKPFIGEPAAVIEMSIGEVSMAIDWAPCPSLETDLTEDSTESAARKNAVVCSSKALVSGS